MYCVSVYFVSCRSKDSVEKMSSYLLNLLQIRGLQYKPAYKNLKFCKSSRLGSYILGICGKRGSSGS